MEAYYSGTFRTKLLPLPSRESIEAAFSVPIQSAQVAIDHSAELLEAHRRIASLEGQLDATMRQSSLDASKLLTQVDLSRHTMERLEEQNRGLAEDLRNCRQQLQQTEEKNHDLEQQLKHLDEACVSLQHKFQRSTSRIMELVAQVKSAEERLEVQRQINVGLEDQLVALTRAASNGSSLDRSTAAIPSSHHAEAEPFSTEQRPGSRSAAAVVAARINSIEEDVRNFYAQFPSSTAPSSQGHPAAADVAPPQVASRQQQLASLGSSTHQPQLQQVTQPPPQKKKTDLNYVVVDQLDSDLVAKCKQRDEIEAKYRKLENAKIRTVAEKARKDSLEHELNILNHDISDIRSQLRGMDQLFK